MSTELFLEAQLHFQTRRSFSEQQQQQSGSLEASVRWLIQRVPLAAVAVAAAAAATEAALAQATAADVSSQRESYSGLDSGVELYLELHHQI